MIAFDSVFHEIAALLLFAAAIGALALWLRQPLIVGYILVGILAGPSVPPGWQLKISSNKSASRRAAGTFKGPDPLCKKQTRTPARKREGSRSELSPP